MYEDSSSKAMAQSYPDAHKPDSPIASRIDRVLRSCVDSVQTLGFISNILDELEFKVLGKGSSKSLTVENNKVSPPPAASHLGTVENCAAGLVKHLEAIRCRLSEVLGSL